jgi:D-alanine-D-alanine ligase
LAVEPVELAPDGRWTRNGSAWPAAQALGAFPERTIFFLALHGAGGEDGSIQGFLKTAGRPHTGSGVEAAALCMNKHHTRLLAADLGLALPAGRCVTASDWEHDRPGVLMALADLGPRLFVKPVRGGSSVGVSAPDDAVSLSERVEAVLRFGDDCLVEAAVEGVEATCAVLEKRGGGAQALPPVEILPSAGRFFDYQQKYDPDGARELCPAVNLTPAACLAMGEAAVTLHRAAGCRGATRSDFIVPRGGAGKPVLLEINTLPGLTERSILPRAARVAGLSFADLCLQLVSLAVPAEWST